MIIPDIRPQRRCSSPAPAAIARHAITRDPGFSYWGCGRDGWCVLLLSACLLLRPPSCTPHPAPRTPHPAPPTLHSARAPSTRHGACLAHGSDGAAANHRRGDRVARKSVCWRSCCAQHAFPTLPPLPAEADGSGCGCSGTRATSTSTRSMRAAARCSSSPPPPKRMRSCTLSLPLPVALLG